MHKKAAQRNAGIALQTAQSAEREAQIGRCSIAMQYALDAMRFVGRVDESLMDVPDYRGAQPKINRAHQSVQNVVRLCSRTSRDWNVARDIEIHRMMRKLR
jgi:hypothetical protein